MGDKEYVNNMLVLRTRFLQAVENLSLKLCVSIDVAQYGKGKQRKINVGRKNRQVLWGTDALVRSDSCAWECVLVWHGGYPRKPGTPGSSIVLGGRGGPHP